VASRSRGGGGRAVVEFRLRPKPWSKPQSEWVKLSSDGSFSINKAGWVIIVGFDVKLLFSC
jgi:hypothetical protein